MFSVFRTPKRFWSNPKISATAVNLVFSKVKTPKEKSITSWPCHWPFPGKRKREKEREREKRRERERERERERSVHEREEEERSEKDTRRGSKI